MKYVICSVAMITICIFAGCKKSSKGPSSGSMTASINGEPFSVNKCTIGSSSLGGLVIDGYDTIGVGRWIQLSITSYTAGATGTYTVTAYPNVTVAATVDSNNAGQDAQLGTITIKTSSASAISGTFSFTCTNGTVVTTVTNGVFNAVQ